MEVTLKAADSNGTGPTICITNAASSLNQEDLPKLFDRFWRGDVSRKESNHCGLGLPVARACAESMNWMIQAIKRPDDEYMKMCIKPSMD
ncbi:MAG: sensor histidine kinase [Verrucomicrobia bacterium]|nr:sensor histidine kinase [Verrucomicrobiota bacterium]